ncbi:uncharacterized protein [Lepisosteus oculatus]|uniref:uncharacterized protein n=1 Tax=Lepisosteus oculatus TaxID=7918 RepID=UPI0037136D09
MAVNSNAAGLGKQCVTPASRVAGVQSDIPKETPGSGERNDGRAQLPSQQESDFLPSVCLAALLLLIFSVVSCVFIFSDPGSLPSPHPPAVPRPPRLASSSDGRLARLRLLFPGQREALWHGLGLATRERPLSHALVLLGGRESQNTLLLFTRSLLSALGGCGAPTKTLRLGYLPAGQQVLPTQWGAAFTVVVETMNGVGGVMVELRREGEGKAVALVTTVVILPESYSAQEQNQLLEAGVSAVEEFLQTLNHTAPGSAGGLRTDKTVLIVEPEGFPDSLFYC